MHNASSLELKRFNTTYNRLLSQAMKHKLNLAMVWRFRRRLLHNRAVLLSDARPQCEEFLTW
jgi:hypothetical protein